MNKSGEETILSLPERHNRIIALLQQNGSISVAQLAELFKVSEVTIRKDLSYLEQQKKLYRTHGSEMCIRDSLLTYELDWDHSLPKLALAALFFAVALVVNNLAGRGPWRRVYRVSWTPLVPLSLWGGLEAWIVSVSYTHLRRCPVTAC